MYIYIYVYISLYLFFFTDLLRADSPNSFPVPAHGLCGRFRSMMVVPFTSLPPLMARHGSTWLDPSSFIKSCYLNHLCQIGPRCFMIFPHFSWDFSHFFQISVPDWRARRCLLCRLHLRWSRPREKMETDMPKTSHEKSEMTRKSSMTFT